MALGPGFEWFVAWRHLRDPGRRSRRTLYIGLGLLAAGAAVLLLLRLAPSLFTVRLGSSGEFFSSRPTVLAENLKVGAIITAAVGLALSILGALLASFTVFTAISIFGVFLGTGAPIIALSVMSGFEADLKSKIRATKADIVVSADAEQPFTNWEAVEAKVKSIDGVVASMAYLEGEVIVKHISNPAGMGIVLRGIDPRRATQVLDLGRTLMEGKVEYLQHPDEIPVDDPDFLRPSMGDGKDKESPRGTGRPVLPGILLGDELYARTLRVYMGSDVDVACPMCGVGPTGPVPKMRPFRVAGHFYTGMYEFDSKLAYAALPDVQKFMGTPGEITGIEIRTRNPDAAREVAAAISGRL